MSKEERGKEREQTGGRGSARERKSGEKERRGLDELTRCSLEDGR